MIVLLSYCEYSHTPPPYHTCPHMFRAPFIPATSLPFPRSTPADVSTCQAPFHQLVRPAFRPLSPHLPNRLLPRLSPRPSPQGGPMAYRTYRYIIWYIINQIRSRDHVVRPLVLRRRKEKRRESLSSLLSSPFDPCFCVFVPLCLSCL